MNASRERLVEAFAQAVYRVFPPPDAAIASRIGEANAPMAALLAEHDATRAVLMSACNPCGIAIDAKANARRHAALCARAQTAGWRTLPAEGASSDRRWVEASLLVFDLDPDSAAALAREFDQAAWLEYDAHGRAALCWAPTREEAR